MLGSTVEMLHEDKKNETKTPVSKTEELNKIDKKSEKISDIQVMEQNLAVTSSPNMIEITLASSRGVTIHKSSGAYILSQDSRVVKQDDKMNEDDAGITPYKNNKIQDEVNVLDKTKGIGIVSIMEVRLLRFSDRFQAWMLKTLADMLLFLRSESVDTVNPRREKEFHKLCDEVVQLGFERSWVDEMRKRVVTRNKLDHAKTQICEVLKTLDHLIRQLDNIKKELRSLNDFANAHTKYFDFL
ncbi:hypothetical protein ACSQ67_017809 [Phaseolus vulgaris]